MADINREQYDVMEKFFGECVRFWEHELKTDSDLDRQPYINALREVPHRYPYVPWGEELDPETRKYFIKNKCMDTYGRDWEKYYNELKLT